MENEITDLFVGTVWFVCWWWWEILRVRSIAFLDTYVVKVRVVVVMVIIMVIEKCNQVWSRGNEGECNNLYMYHGGAEKYKKNGGLLSLLIVGLCKFCWQLLLLFLILMMAWELRVETMMMNFWGFGFVLGCWFGLSGIWTKADDDLMAWQSCNVIWIGCK